MTGFERIETRLPDLMADLAAAKVPDYFDDMLERASQTGQKPAWASLERWLPVDITAQTSTLRGRAPALRPLVILAILALAIVVGAVLYAGSQRQDELPPPFGLARNGTLLIGTADGDIATFDPATGDTRSLISGPGREAGPLFSPDGQRFVFVRTEGGKETLFVSNADGSNVREVGPVGAGDAWWEWAPTSDRLVVTGLDEGKPTVVTILDVDSGARTAFDLGIAASTPTWRSGHDQLVFGNWDSANAGHYVVNADGTGLRRIETADGTISDLSLSPDGSKLAYATWGTGTGPSERIHVIDIDSGSDTVITPDANDGYLWQGPVFLPMADRSWPAASPRREAPSDWP
jgi:Tol biopolymer transport system component